MVIKYFDIYKKETIVIENVVSITVGEKGITYKTIGGNYCYSIGYAWSSRIQIYEKHSKIK